MQEVKEPKLEFYVLNYNWNAKKVVNYNIFNNINVYETAVREAKKYLRNPGKYKHYVMGFGKDESYYLYGKEAFIEELRMTVSWQERSRREYEISVGDAFETDLEKFEKWDCYQQFEPNKELVADYVLNQVRKFLKEQKLKKTTTEEQG